MSEPTPKRCLSHPEFYRLTVWLSSQAERITRERPGKVALARDASAALGLDVSEVTVGSAAECAGLAWEPAVCLGGRAHVSLRPRVERLENQLLEAQRDGEYLAGKLQHLSERLNAQNTMIAHICAEAGISPIPGYKGS